MLRLRWISEALDDFERLHEFMAEHNEDAGNRAAQTLVPAAGSLAEFPEEGRPWGRKLHFREVSVLFGSRGYKIGYRFQNEEFIIVRDWRALEVR